MALTAKDLLDSLHEHLQQQTDLLPALHAQLGLAPSALAADLEHLRAVLAENVDAQVQRRRNEVNEWQETCEKVEKDCIKLAKCLGGHGRSLPSVAEYRKNAVLPKRYEQLLAHQDKLQQLYSAKLEQRNAITSRLHAFSRTLGAGFFPGDVLHISSSSSSSHPSVPVLPTDDSRRDVTPERFSKLEKEIDRARTEVNRRLVQLSATLQEVVWLHCELGLELPAPDIGLDDLSMISAVTASPSKATTSSQPPRDPNEVIFARFVARLEEAGEEDLETLGVEGVDPTLAVMEWAEGLRDQLEEMKKEREQLIQGMYDRLEILWKRLGIPEGEVDAFVEGNCGTSGENVRAYEAELERMVELKRQSMSTFIDNARAEIQSLWNDLFYGEEERKGYESLDGEHTDELLARHEEEILRLKSERRTKAPLLLSIQKWKDVCRDEEELEASVNDSSRLTGRGPRDPGRLLREEKMRKRVKKDKPRLEQELLQSLPHWEEEYQQQFCVDGVRVVDLLLAKVNADQALKDKKPQRAGSVAPLGTRSRATTPASTAPLSSNGNSTRKHSATPLTSQGPAKRQRTTGIGSRATTPTSTTGPLRMSTMGNAGAVPPLPAFSKHLAGLNGKSGIPMPGSGSKTYGVGMGVSQNRGTVNGRIPSDSTMRTVSHGSSSTAVGGRSSGGSGVSAAAIVAKKTRRESFRPRASMDNAPLFSGSVAVRGSVAGTGGVWAGSATSVKEEDEDE